jgi:hypothetical protein
MNTKLPLQKILQGILHTEDESKQNHKKGETPNHKRRKDKQSQSSIHSSAHNQILKKQKQLNGREHHKHININTEC